MNSRVSESRVSVLRSMPGVLTGHGNYYVLQHTKQLPLFILLLLFIKAWFAYSEIHPLRKYMVLWVLTNVTATIFKISNISLWKFSCASLWPTPPPTSSPWQTLISFLSPRFAFSEWQRNGTIKAGRLFESGFFHNACKIRLCWVCILLCSLLLLLTFHQAGSSVHVSIPQLRNIWAVSRFWFFWIKMLWIVAYRSFCEHKFSSLDHMIIIRLTL